VAVIIGIVTRLSSKRSAERLIDLPGCSFLHAREHVAVALQGEGNARVSKALAYHFRVCAGRKQAAAMRVPEVME
jgi:hypothetical protein